MNEVTTMASESDRRRILVTGVADFAGSELLRELEEDERVEHVAGIDFREPRCAFKRADVMAIDLRSTGLKNLLEGMKPDTILHLQRLRSDQEGVSPEEMHEINVMGTINLTATVQSLPFVKKFVLMSALHAYSPDPLDPAVLTEEIRPRTPAKTKYAGDLMEMEAAFEQLGRSGRKITLTRLRFADIIGPKVNNPISRYLRMPVVPTILGFDPRLQFCHEEDAVNVLRRAALFDIPGLFNVAGDGVIYLSRALRLGGCVQVPIAPPLAGAVFAALRTLGIADIQPFHMLLLRYGRVIDNSRLKTRFGFRPRYSTVEAVLDLYGKSTLERAAWQEAEEPESEKVAAA
ncbi:MAG: NAD-dependent epimerase/dehydratase family protein [Candidatus Binataceae bacterium]